jgi:hypothetical protein
MNGDGSRAWRETASDLVVELALFLCSYAPLFAILAIRFRNTWLALACGAFAALGVSAGASVLWRYRSVTAASLTMRRIEDRGGEVAGYLATYLLPFVTVTEPGWRDVLGYALFLVIIAVVYVRSGLVQINPTLYLFGWRLFAVDIGDGWSGYLLSRRPIGRGEQVEGVRMTERLFITYRKREKRGR